MTPILVQCLERHPARFRVEHRSVFHAQCASSLRFGVCVPNLQVCFSLLSSAGSRSRFPCVLLENRITVGPQRISHPHMLVTRHVYQVVDRVIDTNSSFSSLRALALLVRIMGCVFCPIPVTQFPFSSLCTLALLVRVKSGVKDFVMRFIMRFIARFIMRFVIRL